MNFKLNLKKLFSNKQKIFFLFFLLFILIFSGCDSNIGINSNSYNEPQKKDVTGSGLEVNFKLNDKWIDTRLISYELSLKNSGLKEIVLTPNNFKITTLEVGNVLLGIDKFNENLFKNSNLILYHDQNLDPAIKGEFEISPKYFSDLTHSKITINLNINYDYSTDFENNVKIDMNKKTLKVLDSLSQAAPVQMNNIILKPTSNLGIYELGFYIKDLNSNFNMEDKLVKFSSIDLNFGTKRLNDCNVYSKVDGVMRNIGTLNNLNEIVLNSNNHELVFVCKVDLSYLNSNEIQNTIVSGNLKYNYRFKIVKTINLPKKREIKNSW